MRLRVGLSGGIGTGKSVVAERLATRGAVIVDADLLSRAVVAPGTPGLAAVASRWPQALDPRGSLDRAALGRVVFADPAQRATLEAIVHPLVRAAGRAAEEAAPADAIVVHVVPLLFEGDFWRSCDRTVLVVAPLATRMARLRARDGHDDAEIAARMAAQIAPEEALRRADEIIVNDGDRAALDARVDALWAHLRTASGGRRAR